MEGSRIDPAALLAAVIAGGLALTVAQGPFGWLTTGGGITLLLILFAYDQDGYRNLFQSLAFSAVCGFTLALASAIFWQNTSDAALLKDAALSKYLGERLAFTWIGVVFVATIVDRIRMSSRMEASDLRGSERLSVASTSLHRSPAYAAPPPAPLTSVQMPMAAPAPASTAPAVSPSISETLEAPVEPLSFGPLSFGPPPAASTPEPAPVASPSPPAEAPRPVGIPVQGGKTVTIFVGLSGEGLNMLRPVLAQQVRRDFYLIVEPMPENEAWQFQTGQIVRVQKRNLSSGKGLVAVEEAPKAS